ncbi:RecQ family ATP-dependent DNA helicase [Spirochaeta dissipatitropha]
MNAGISFLFPVQRMVIAGILDALQFEESEFIKEYHPRGQIAVLPTGAGKSLCFQIPTALDGRPVLVLYPLLALLQDQKRRFDELGIPAAVIRGGQSKQERSKIWRAVKEGEIKAILSNPEAMIQDANLKMLKDMHIVHLIVDEAHCICEWGKTFRPGYLEIPRIQNYARIPVLSAFTATAGPQVLETIRENLFPDYSPQELIGTPDRPNMAIRIMATADKDTCIVEMFRSTDRIRGGTAELPMWTPGAEMPRPAIVFCASRSGTEELATRLRKDHGDCVNFYHAGLEKQIKDSLESWFFSSNDGILVSTCAYGMGVDKKNIRSVIHRDISQSVESYIQEAGRGGRDRTACQAVLLISPPDLTSARRMPKGFQRKRLEQLIEWINEPGCHRESLLRKMDCEPEPCFGCSRCCSDPPLAVDSYWHRMAVFLRELTSRSPLDSREKELLLQLVCREFEWDRFELPAQWMKKLPMMPEWDEGQLKSILSEIPKKRQDRKAFVKLINIV